MPQVSHWQLQRLWQGGSFALRRVVSTFQWTQRLQKARKPNAKDLEGCCHKCICVLILLFPSKDFSFASQIGIGWHFNSQWVKESEEGRRGASWYEGAATMCGPNAIFVFQTCLEGMVPEYTKYTICPNNHPACLHRPLNGPKGSLWSWGQCQLAKNTGRYGPILDVCVGEKSGM